MLFSFHLVSVLIYTAGKNRTFLSGFPILSLYLHAFLLPPSLCLVQCKEELHLSVKVSNIILHAFLLCLHRPSSPRHSFLWSSFYLWFSFFSFFLFQSSFLISCRSLSHPLVINNILWYPEESNRYHIFLNLFLQVYFLRYLVSHSRVQFSCIQGFYNKYIHIPAKCIQRRNCCWIIEEAQRKRIQRTFNGRDLGKEFPFDLEYFSL